MNDAQIHTIATWKIKPGNLETVLAALKILQAKSIEEKGNLFYKVYEVKSNPCTVILYEGYVDEDALDLHRNSKHYIETVVEKIRPLLEHREVVLMTPLDV